MKWFLIVLFLVFSTNLFCVQKVVEKTTVSTVSGNEFELAMGPFISIKDTITSFTITPMIGTERFKFGLSYAIGSLAGVTTQSFRPALMIDYPYYFNFGEGSSIGVGPTFDFGPAISFGAGLKQISFMTIGLGAKIRLFFNKNIGIGFTPIHMTMQFANWTSGGVGTNTGFAVSYDVFASLIYRW